MEAVGLGGSGGLEGKYVKNNRKHNTAKPNSEINKKMQMATLKPTHIWYFKLVFVCVDV